MRHAVRHTGGHANVASIQDAIQQRVESGALIREAPHYRNAQDQRTSPMTWESWAAEVTRLSNVAQPAALQLFDQAIASERLLMEAPRYATREASDAEARILSAELAGRAPF